MSELTEAVFYAQTILSDDTRIDARPSDALTLALVTGTPNYVAASVLEHAEQTAPEHSDLLEEANQAPDDARVIAAEARAAHAASVARLLNPNQ